MNRKSTAERYRVSISRRIDLSHRYSRGMHAATADDAQLETIQRVDRWRFPRCMSYFVQFILLVLSRCNEVRSELRTIYGIRVSLSLSAFSSHNENRSLPDSYLLRNDIRYGRVIDYFNARVWSPAALIKICQHWRASCKLVSIASKTGIPPWGQPKMQSRMNMMIVVRRQHFLPDPLIHKTKNRVSFFAAPSPLPLLLPSSVFSTVFTYGFHSINLDSL